jgi:putative transposase
MKAYKYRIYPTNVQAVAIDANIESCRQLYNKLLNLKISAYEKEKKRLSRFDLNKRIKGTVGLHSQVCQNVSNRIDKAFRNFFARIKRNEKEKGFPRYKKYGKYSSITLPQIANPKKIGKKTYFPRIGLINTKYHRPITGTPKTLTIKKSQSGKYFITVCCDGAENAPIKTTSKEVGIDLGLNHFVATSDGKFYDHPKPLKQLSRQRRLLNRRFSNTKKRSNNRNKARAKLARLDEKIANIRNDFGWKLCRKIINKYGTIYAEDLSIRNMQQNHRLAGAITDVSWADFLAKLSYKAESAGGKVIKVNPRKTSQKCSACGTVAKKTLATRTHKCSCGLKIDRDTNAALNILAIGKIGLEQPKLSLKEIVPIHSAKAEMQAPSMKQEATQLVGW